MYLLFVSKRCSVDRRVCRLDLQVINTNEMTSPKLHRDESYTGVDLYATYFEFC